MRAVVFGWVGAACVVAPLLWAGCSSVAPGSEGSSGDAGVSAPSASAAPPPAPSSAPPQPPPAPPSCTPMLRGRVGVDKSTTRLEPLRRLRQKGVPMSGCDSDGGVVVDSGGPAPVPTDAGAPVGDDSGAVLGTDAGAPGDDASGPYPTGDGGYSFDWNFPTAGPVNAAVAIVGPSYPNPSSSDAIYFGAESGSPNFYMLTNIYAASPTVAWSTTTGGLFGSGITLSGDDSEVYALDQTGALYCFAAATGDLCSGWPTQSVNPGVNHTVSWSSPWLDYPSGDIFYGDNNGYLFKVDSATGATIWSYQLTTAALESDVLYEAPYLYLGDMQGNIYRVQDPGTSPPTASNVSSFSDCSPSCSSNAAIPTGPTLDVSSGNIYFAGNGSLFQFTIGAGIWAPTATSSLNMPPGINSSSPMVDGAGTLWVGFYGGVFRVPYPLTAANPPIGAFLYGQGTGANGPTASPKSGPLSFNGSVYIGDPAGMVEQYTCLTQTGAPALDAVTIPYGATVDSSPLIDYMNGNVVFGYTGSTGAGGLVQITQAGGWGCGSQAPCASAGCGGSVCAPAMGCVPNLVPPSEIWLSGGGGTSAISGGDTAALSIGGLCAGDMATVNGATLWFGGLANDAL